MKKNGFTLVELLGVIVVLAIIVLLAVTAVVPIVNKAKKGALVDEALAYVKAAKQAYTVDNENNSKTVCYEISYLNEKYINKDATGYSGAIIINGSINNIMTSLSDGNLYLYNNGSSKIKAADVSKTIPTGFVSSCGNYNPVLSNEVNTNSLVYKLIMANGKSTLEANLNDISTRSASVDFSNLADTAAESGLFTAPDDDGASYYYRGIVNNNWVSFAGFYWRIIRINGDGSIRMIYTGTPSSNHLAANAQIGGSSFGDYTAYTTTTPDVTGLTNTTITTTYRNGRFQNTHVGYMYNPTKIISSDPTYALDNSHKLNAFHSFSNITETTQYYFFKNFNPNTDCFTGDGTDETGTCTIKCAALGTDCVLSTYGDLANNTSNYSTTATGVYSDSYVYTGQFKYTCWDYGTAVTKANSNSTTSVYISCPLASEIVGTIKNQNTKTKVRYLGLFSPDAETAYSNVRDSAIKIYVENWYQTNIYNKKDSFNKYYEEYLADEIFCDDRTASDSQIFPLRVNNHYLHYIYNRISSTKEPSFKCPYKGRDGFTLTTSARISAVKASGKGNKKLKYPVGLLTADEVVYAGGGVGNAATNTSYYLHTGANYWTITPYGMYSTYGTARVLYVRKDYGYLSTNYTSTSYGVRPVINLSSDVLFNSGNGTESNPYTVKLR